MLNAIFVYISIPNKQNDPSIVHSRVETRVFRSEDEMTETIVSFCCQRCCQPLKVNSTLSTIDDQIISELNSNTTSDATRKENQVFAPKDCPKNVIYKVIPPISSQTYDSSNGNGFIVIEENNSSLTPSMVNIGLCGATNKPKADSSNSIATEKVNKAQEDKRLRQLFDILSDQSDVDHPLCEECADIVIDRMDEQLRQLEDESKEYNDYLTSLQSEQNSDQIVSDQEVSDLTEKLNNLVAIEKQLMAELEENNEQQKKMDEELERQSSELQRLFAEEDKYWHEYNNVRNSIFTLDDEQQSVDNQLRYAQALFDKLKRTNVFNATFHIWLISKSSLAFSNL